LFLRGCKKWRDTHRNHFIAKRGVGGWGGVPTCMFEEGFVPSRWCVYREWQKEREREWEK
jgi:hypothetical protein